MYSNNDCCNNSGSNFEGLLTALILIVAIGSFIYGKENYEVNKDNYQLNEEGLDVNKEMLETMKSEEKANEQIS